MRNKSPTKGSKYYSIDGRKATRKIDDKTKECYSLNRKISGRVENNNEVDLFGQRPSEIDTSICEL